MKKVEKNNRDGRKMKGKRVIAGILLVGILAVALAGGKNTDENKKETGKPVITLGSDNRKNRLIRCVKHMTWESLIISSDRLIL